MESELHISRSHPLCGIPLPSRSPAGFSKGVSVREVLTEWVGPAGGRAGDDREELDAMKHD